MPRSKTSRRAAPPRETIQTEREEQQQEENERREPGPVGPLEAFYDQSIAPLMAQIARLCEEGGIDFLTHFALDADGDSYRAAGRCRIVRDGLGDMRVAHQVLRGGAELHVISVEMDALPGAPRRAAAPDEVLH